MRTLFSPTSVAALSTLLGLAAGLPAQVSEWHFFKGSVYIQDATNQMPTAPDGWGAGASVVLGSATDAGRITISGGNINGALDLQHEGGGEWYLERGYPSRAAMNAEFPGNSSYVLTISGGSLGLRIQAFTVGAEVYPSTPYLTGTSYDVAAQFPVGANTTLTWNDPGAATRAAGFTVLDIIDRSEQSVYEDLRPGAHLSATIPARSLPANACHWGTVEFTVDTTLPGSNFGVAGLAHHIRGTGFEIRTWPHPTPPCAYSQTYGAGCANLELHSNAPILGTSWDLTTDGIPHGITGFTLISLGPQDPPLPLQALGINAPGCNIYVDPFTVQASPAGVGSNGQMTISIPVPSDPSLAGVWLFAQTLALTPSTPASLGTSNSVEALLGS